MKFVFDLDGTLLNDDSHIPVKTWAWIQKLKKEGHQLYINTGRPYEAILQGLGKQSKIFTGIASYNGAKLTLANKNLMHQVPFALVSQIHQLFPKDKFCTTISLGNDLYTDDPQNAHDIIRRLKPVKILPLTNLPKQVYSIRLIFENFEQSQSFYQKIKTKFPNYNIVMSSGIYILITNKLANKKLLINHLLKSNEQVIFFGDSQNDLDVFKMPQVFKVAPQNAFSSLKELANLVLETTNNENLAFDLTLIKPQK